MPSFNYRHADTSPHSWMQAEKFEIKKDLFRQMIERIFEES